MARLRVAHLRHGLPPVLEGVTKKGLRVQMTSPDDENEDIDQADAQLTACREEPRVKNNNEECDIELTKAGMNKELKAMQGFGV